MKPREIRLRLRPFPLLLIFAVAMLLAAARASAQSADGPSIGPDATISNVNGIVRWGEQGGIVAYSIGRTHCNLGDTNLLWQVSPSPNHPISGHNMFRITPGNRIEQLGQGWPMHHFCALQITCRDECPGGGGCLSILRPGCYSPNTAGRSGGQGGLGPKWLVQPFTGVFPPLQPGEYAPFRGLIARRVQVHVADLGDPESIYIAENQTITRDDAEAGNQHNNVSHRLINIGPAPTFAFQGFVGDTLFRQPAIQAWQNHDPGVAIEIIQVPDDGQLWLAYKVTDNGDGTWHYEYALYNMNSHRSARAFTVPVTGDVALTEIGFHDVDYHSGDGHDHTTYDGTDWAVTEGGDGITWSTSTFLENLNANAPPLGHAVQLPLRRRRPARTGCGNDRPLPSRARPWRSRSRRSGPARASAISMRAAMSASTTCSRC